MIRHTILAAALALGVAGAASAEVLKPVQARDIDAQGIDLGAVSGVVYYTAEPDGFRVVATLAPEGEDAVPVRVEAILAPGQSVVLSTPHRVGEAPETVQISRQANTVLVHKATAAAMN